MGRAADGTWAVARAVSALCLAFFLIGADAESSLLASSVGAEESSEIVEAARKGDLETVRAMVESGGDVNAAQGDGMTALHWAAEHDHTGIAMVLLDAGADLEVGTRIGHYTPLHVASKRGSVAVGRLLIEAGADVNAATTNSGATPLHLAAAAAAAEELVSALIEHGADVNAREASSGQTPLMLAAGFDRAGAVEVLLANGADPGLTTEVVDVLGRIAADVLANEAYEAKLASFRPDGEDGENWSPSPAQLQEAIEAKREVLRATPEVPGYDLSDADVGDSFNRGIIRERLVGKEGGMTALLHAAREGNSAAARALLDGGAEINQVSDADAASALVTALINGHFDLAMELLERGADPNLATSTEGATPLFAVLQTQYAPVAIYPQPRAHHFQTAEYQEVIQALLEAGADPNVSLKTHPFYWEYSYGRIGLDITGATPFWRAAFAQDTEAMRLLAAYGADPHEPTRLPPVDMRKNRQQDGRLQEDSGLPPVPAGEPNAFPIHVAAGGGHLGLGYVRHSVPDGFMEAVKYLVEEHGADVNEVDWWGYTPLHYAASRGDNEMIEYLVSLGADVGALTRLGQSPADMARGGRAGYFDRVAYPATVALLESLGSPLVCLHTHFNGTGDHCEFAGTTEFEDRYGFTRVPLVERSEADLQRD